MSVSLTPEQQTWLTARVERGEFRSLEEAARQLIDERIAERMVEDNDDLAWAKHYIDKADEDIATGKVMTREEHEARMDDLLASMKD